MRKIIFSLLLSTSIPTFAGSWLGDFDIQNLVVEGANQLPIANISLIPNPQTACADNTFATMATDSEMGKQALSVFMIAASAKKKVKVYIDGCVGNRPKILYVWLIN